MVQNFPRRNGPVNTYWSHDTKGRRSRNSGEAPALSAASVQKIWTDGDLLWGTLDAGPKAWSAVIEEKGVKSYSIEWGQDGENTQGERLSGSYLDAGIFTNDSALDMQWQASAPDPDTKLRLSRPLSWASPVEEEDMPAKTIEQLTTENEQLDAKVKKFETAEAKRKTDDEATAAKITALEAKVAAKAEPKADPEKITALERSNEELKGKNAVLESGFEKLKSEQLGRDVIHICQKAIDEGVPPSKFPDFEKDPMALLAKRGGTLEALKDIAASYDRVPFGTRKFGKTDTGTASGDPEQALHLAATKLASEKNVAYTAALDLVRDQQPSVYQAAVAAREEKRTRSLEAHRGE
jgi:hypothetical protein